MPYPASSSDPLVALPFAASSGGSSPDVATPDPIGSPRDVARRVASRRSVLVGAAAAVALGGCATYDQRAPAGEPAAPAPGGGADTPATGGVPATSGPAAAGGPTSGAATGAPPPPALAASADIPVGGGRIFEKQGVVVTQPRAGEFKAFSATCTHQGCSVGEVRNGTINCPCHGSQFKIADGSVAKGPAARGLAAVPLTVDGANLRLA